MQLGEIIWVSIDKVKPNNYNPNVMNHEKFEALCDFLKTHKAEELDPIWVRRDGADGFEVIDGEHRWKAAKTVGWKRLRAFVTPLDEDGAKAFNVRKNRERGNIDAIKFGKLLAELKTKNISCEDLAKRFGYFDHAHIAEYIRIYENQDAIFKHFDNVGRPRPKHISQRLGSKVLRQLKHPQQEETDQPKLEEEPADSFQTMERFLSDYKEALKKMPKDTPKDDDIQIAIKFFKKLLNEKNVVCPICGEAHLQWRCGHEF